MKQFPIHLIIQSCCLKKYGGLCFKWTSFFKILFTQCCLPENYQNLCRNIFPLLYFIRRDDLQTVHIQIISMSFVTL